MRPVEELWIADACKFSHGSSGSNAPSESRPVLSEKVHGSAALTAPSAEAASRPVQARCPGIADFRWVDNVWTVTPAGSSPVAIDTPHPQCYPTALFRADRSTGSGQHQDRR